MSGVRVPIEHLERAWRSRQLGSDCDDSKLEWIVTLTGLFCWKRRFRPRQPSIHPVSIDVRGAWVVAPIGADSEVLDEDTLHMLALQKPCNPFHDIAAQVELDGNIWVLVSIVDSGAHGKLHDIAIEQHGRQTHGGI